MIRSEKCKLSIGGCIYRVCECSECETSKECWWKVLRQRNVVKGGSYFNDYRQAVLFMLRTAFMEFGQMEIEGLV